MPTSLAESFSADLATSEKRAQTEALQPATLKKPPNPSMDRNRLMTETPHLPLHGRIECSSCHHPQPYAFDRTRTEKDGWRITNNPMAWGGSEPEVVVLGFSKGPTQAGALAGSAHDTIAYKGGRSAVAKILHHIGLIERADVGLVDALIANPGGPIHFGSLVRCTVERWDENDRSWKGTGGGMLDRFIATGFGSDVAETCGTTFLSRLPSQTLLIVMLGLGSNLNYVRACRSLYERIRPGTWQQLNEVSYTDGKVVVVHTEHFASQGALLPNWLSGTAHERGRLGMLAQEAVTFSGARMVNVDMTFAEAEPLRPAPILSARNRFAPTPRTAKASPIKVPLAIEEQLGVPQNPAGASMPDFVFRPQRAQAFGRPLEDGSFMIISGSTAMRSGSPNKKRDLADRDALVRSGVLVPHSDPSLYRFSRDHVFGSSSKAAGIVKDGNASGPQLWKHVESGESLRDYLARNSMRQGPV